MPNMSQRPKGFTLVELLVITPLVILLVGGVVVVTIQATTSALRSFGRTQLQYDVISALDMMERDVKLSVRMANVHDGIELDSLATSTNPLDPERQLVRRSDCEHVDGGLAITEATQYTRAYVIEGQSLVRRVDFSDKWCGGSQSAQGDSVWQRHGVDEVLIKEADVSFLMEYGPDPMADLANEVTVTLTAKRQVAGQELSFSARRHMRSMNNDI